MFIDSAPFIFMDYVDYEIKIRKTMVIIIIGWPISVTLSSVRQSH